MRDTDLTGIKEKREGIERKGKWGGKLELEQS